MLVDTTHSLQPMFCNGQWQWLFLRRQMLGTKISQETVAWEVLLCYKRVSLASSSNLTTWNYLESLDWESLDWIAKEHVDRKMYAWGRWCMLSTEVQPESGCNLRKGIYAFYRNYFSKNPFSLVEDVIFFLLVLTNSSMNLFDAVVVMMCSVCWCLGNIPSLTWAGY